MLNMYSNPLFPLLIALLIVVNFGICMQDDRPYRDYSHELRRESRDQHRASEEIVEVSTEHLQRYWGQTGQSTSPMSPIPHQSQSIGGSFTSNYQGQQQQQQRRSNGENVDRNGQTVHRGSENISPNVNSGRIGNQGVFLISKAEREIIDELKMYILNSGSYSTWLRSVTNTELVRFIRARKGDLNTAWQMIWDHSLWRQSPMGADSISISDDQFFQSCSLNNELYWSGLAYDGSPVLIFKTGLHQSGAVDATYYTRFVVWLLEKGKREYGVGTTRQLYVIIDRTPSESKDSYFGSPSAATNLPIMKSVFSAVQDNYPEILKKAIIVPATTITRMLFLGASALMDERSREKFTLIKSDDHSWWRNLFSENILPHSILGFRRDFQIDLNRGNNVINIDNYGYQQQY